MNATDILERVNQTYGTLSSYRDRGIILQYRRDAVRPHEEHFRTWFVRPLSIRLDWRTHHPHEPLRHLVTHYSICAHGQAITRWQDRPECLDHETEIGLAFAGAPTVSIPNLLLPHEIGSFRFDQLQATNVAGAETIQDVRCLRIVGEHPLGSEYQVWVGEGDFLIRRVRTDYRTSVEENEFCTGVSDCLYREVAANASIEQRVFSTPGSLLDAG